MPQPASSPLSATPGPQDRPVRNPGDTFTGERPGWGEGFEYDYARHMAAYRLAATMTAGRRVLDAGCGEGFGTSTLAGSATEVVGVDYSPEAVEQCRRLWVGPERPNLRFEVADLSRPARPPRPAGPAGAGPAGAAEAFPERFDLVLSFQVLEHMRDSQAFLAALRQRLEPGGLLLLTTPNRLRTVSENPYHVREYTAGELAEELAGVFADVTIRGIGGNDKVERFEAGRARAVARILALDPLGIRNLLPRSALEFAFARLARVVRRRAQPRADELIVPDDFSVSDCDIDRALDLVAVCTAGDG